MQLKNLKLLIYNAYKEIRSVDAAPLRIEEVDVKNKQVILRSQGASAILKISFADAIGDPSIISNLLPLQACWLGYYAGLAYAQCNPEEQNLLLKNKKHSFLLSFKKGSFKIISQDRKSYITYLDTYTNDVFSTTSLHLAQTPNIIKHFDPSQACYIGISAGICEGKSITKISTQHKKPILRRIK